jgi:hypothetical protein
MIKPAVGVRHKLRNFLSSRGIPESHHQYLGNEDFLRINSTVSHLEQMLNVQFMVFRHKNFPVQYIRSVVPFNPPRQIRDAIDFVGGLTHLPSYLPVAEAVGSHSGLPPLESRRLTEAKLVKKIPYSPTEKQDSNSLIMVANPLSWRGANISMMVMPRCANGQIPDYLFEACSSEGDAGMLRALRAKIEPTNKWLSKAEKKKLKLVDVRFSLNQNLYWSSRKLHKMVKEVDGHPFCLSCDEWKGHIHEGVDAGALCRRMRTAAATAGFGGNGKVGGACLFRFARPSLLGERIKIKLNLYYASAQPTGPMDLGDCFPGASSAECQLAFVPQPTVTLDYLRSVYHIPSPATLHDQQAKAKAIVHSSVNASAKTGGGSAYTKSWQKTALVMSGVAVVAFGPGKNSISPSDINDALHDDHLSTTKLTAPLYHVGDPVEKKTKAEKAKDISAWAPVANVGGGTLSSTAKLQLELAMALAPQVLSPLSPLLSIYLIHLSPLSLLSLSHLSPSLLSSHSLISHLAPQVPTTLWTVGKQVTGAATQQHDPFLEYLIGLAQDLSPPLVQAIVYAEDESHLPPKYLERMNRELGKAGLRGITMLVTSGTDGVGGLGVRATGQKGCKKVLYSSTVLIHCTHALYSYTELMHCTHTLYSYTVLILLY